jgi:hypothetical protein
VCFIAQGIVYVHGEATLEHNHHHTHDATRSCIAIFLSNIPKVDIVLACAGSMGKRSRVQQWKDGEQTVLMLSKALAQACPQLFMANEKIYESDEMQSGIDHDALNKWAKNLLHPLVELDPRGGIFSQKDMQDAMIMLGNQDTNKAHLEKTAHDQRIIPSVFFIVHGSWKNIWMSEVGPYLTGNA